MAEADRAVSLAARLSQLGLPADFASRNETADEKVDLLVRRLDEEISGANKRTFALGLWFGFIGVAEQVLAQAGATSQVDALATFVPEKRRGTGKTVKTLTIAVPGHPRVGLRNFLNRFAAAAWDLGRVTYPNAPGHAAAAWPEYADVVNEVFALDPDGRYTVAVEAWSRLLELPSLERSDPSKVTIRPFEKLLSDFHQSRGDPAGTVLQGLVYAYLSADAPDVRLETGKSKAGSSRLKRTGDVDGRSGGSLVLTVEVKDEHLTAAKWSSVEGFLRNLTSDPDATAIVVAAGFDEDIRDRLRDLRVLTETRSDLLRAVQLWDIRKQRLAMRGFEYYLVRVEGSPRLQKRFRQFVEDHGLTIG